MSSSPPAPERHFETIAQCARDGIVTISADMTVQYANPAVEDIVGYPPDELVGRSLTEVLSDEPARDLEEWVDRYLRTGERTTDWGDIRIRGRHRDGRSIPLSVSLSDFEQDGRRYFTGIVRDVTEQERREERLTGLNRLAQQLTDAESAREICDRTVDAARTILAHPVAAIALYDDEDGRLEPCAWTPEVDEIATGDGQLFETERSIPWDVFVTQEQRVVNDLLAETELEATDTQLRSAVVHPIGTYGVFVAGATEADAFRDEDVDLTRLLVGNAYSTLERVDREQALRERKDQLAEKTASLERLRRINDVIRELTTVLTESSGREEITSEVCTRLAESDPYRFVWFGSHDPANDEVVPEAAAGDERGYLDAITVTTAESTREPVGNAVRTRTVQLRNNVYQDPPFEPWQQEAIQRGYRASIAVPILYRGTLYGALALYAAEADVFDQLEVSVLQELGETIGYALNAAERKQAFTSDRSIELAFEVVDRGDSILGMVDEVGGRFELENLVERSDGSTSAFFTVRGSDPDEVIAWAKERAQLHEIQFLADRDETYLFECKLDESAVWSQLQQRGGVVCEADATPDSARIVVRIPRSADPRSFDALLEEEFGSVELVARREFEEPVMTPEEFEAKFRDRLTDRQDEVLQTAYYAGFFEWPRDTQSDELADILGIAQPTVSRHIRSGEEKFLSMMYDDQ
ncbi:bacterio-opsin activator domain-containing protein [Natronococcus wangiae]|uniref:bacterio-opsin activator domain-containing protein n=1 Tax=Natronococcus wangiae TaxID=3068275 RepID=UPI00273D27CA|nr:bacterio-opsin activator domain-containing protein [Natronococcus sp. AD5]